MTQKKPPAKLGFFAGFGKNSVPYDYGDDAAAAAAAQPAPAPPPAQPPMFVASTIQEPSNSINVRVVNTLNYPLLSTILSIDGVTLLDGDTVLLIGQTDGRQNGVYRYSALSQQLTLDPRFPGAVQLAGKTFDVLAGLTGLGASIQCTLDPDTVVAGQAITFRASGIASGVTPTAITDAVGLPGTSLLASPSDHRHPMSLLHKGFSARLVSVVNIPLNLALPTLVAIDGVLPVIGDRILLVGQTLQAQNGLYVLGANGFLTRAPEVNLIQALAGQTVTVYNGLLFFGTKWLVQSPIDTDLVGGVTSILDAPTPTPILIYQQVQASDGGMLVPFAVRASLASVASGAVADDQPLLALTPTRWPNGFPFPTRLMNVDMYITVVSATGTIQLATQAALGGLVLTNPMAAAALGHVRDAMGVTPPVIPAGTPIFAHRTLNVAGADFLLTFGRNL